MRAADRVRLAIDARAGYYADLQAGEHTGHT
jgi:hypothetical protein